MALTLSGSNGVAGVDGSAGTPALQGSDTNTGIAFGSDTILGSTGGTERFRVDSSGRFGIGTASPNTPVHCEAAQAELQLKSTTGTNSAGLRFVPGGQTNAWYIYANGSRNLVFDDHASERMRIDSSGRLLVGTSSASTSQGATTIIQGNSSGGSTSYAQCVLAIGTNAPANGDTLGEIRFSDSGHNRSAQVSAKRDGGTWTSGSSMPSRLEFTVTRDGASSPTEALRIDRNGFLQAFAADTVFILSTAVGAGVTNALIDGRYSASGVNNGTRSFIVFTNGNVQNTNNSYTAISDIKLKENIVDASTQWEDIKALQVRNYNLKEGQTHKQIGLIAQEVEPISPGLVYESPDRDEDGNDLGTVTKSVNYSVLYMKAVKALQEAMERIESLETRLAALEVTP